MLVGWVLCENCGHAHLAINSPAVSPALPTNITPGQALDHPNNHPGAFTNRIFNSHPSCQFNPFYSYIDIWQSPNSYFKHKPKLIHLMFPLSFFISHGKSCQQYLTDDMGKGVGSRKGKEAIPRTDILSIPGGRQCIITAHIPQLLVTSQDKQPNTLEYSLWGGGSHTPCDHLIIMGHHKCWCQSIRNVLYLGIFCYILNVWLISRGYNECLLDVNGCCDQELCLILQS